jgi:L-arabinose isomerase
MDHNTAETQAFNSYDGANMHVSMAKDYLTQAAYIHGNDVASGAAPSSTVLDLKYLGKANELHEDYAADLTEGKNKYVR